MACGRVENCSDQLCLAPAILPQNEYLSELDQFLDYNSDKKRFLWNGNANDLGKFIEDRILSLKEDEHDAQELVISSNSQCTVFKTPLATINFYYSTKTLQVQGKACSKMRNRLGILVVCVQSPPPPSPWRILANFEHNDGPGIRKFEQY